MVEVRKTRGVPTMLPLEVKDNPLGRPGDTETLLIGPPALRTTTSWPSFFTMVMVVLVEANESDGAISMTSSATAKVWVVELVVALTV